MKVFTAGGRYNISILGSENSFFLLRITYPFGVESYVFLQIVVERFVFQVYSWSRNVF